MTLQYYFAHMGVGLVGGLTCVAMLNDYTPCRQKNFALLTCGWSNRDYTHGVRDQAISALDHKGQQIFFGSLLIWKFIWPRYSTDIYYEVYILYMCPTSVCIVIIMFNLLLLLIKPLVLPSCRTCVFTPFSHREHINQLMMWDVKLIGPAFSICNVFSSGDVTFQATHSYRMDSHLYRALKMKSVTVY